MGLTVIACESNSVYNWVFTGCWKAIPSELKANKNLILCFLFKERQINLLWFVCKLRLK